MEKIINNKNIIFDLGGVLLNIDPVKSITAFINMGLGKDYIDESFRGDGLFNVFEKGEISEEIFRLLVKEKIKSPVSDSDIDKAWNAMLLDFPSERIEMLLKLKSTHKIYLLSNTNIIHWKYYTKQIKQKYNIELDECFHATFYSHEIGHRKPSKEIFQYMINKTNLLPHQSVFIDDIEENALAANLLGINSCFLDLKSGEDILDLF